MNQDQRLLVIKFILTLSFLLSFSNAIRGYWNSFQIVEIPEKEIFNTITTQGRIYASFWVKDSHSRLSLNLYDVVLKIYDKTKNISTDRYDVYTSSFDYVISGNKVIDRNEPDSNPWNFIKPLIILYNLKKSFTLITKKGEFLFTKHSDRFIISEVYNSYEISKGFIKIFPSGIYLELRIYIPKNTIEGFKYTLKSTLKVNVKLE